VSLSGYIDGPPQKTGISFGDPVAGTAAAGAIVMALLARKRSGKGQYIEMAQREVLTSQIGEYIVGYSMNGEIPERIGNRHPSYAPHGCYPTTGEDRWITIACRNDHEFAALCAAMGDPGLAEDPRFRDAHKRHASQDELDAIIADWTRGKSSEDLFQLLTEARVPSAPVLNHVDLYHDKNLRERGFFQKVEHRDAGTWEMDGPAYHFAHRPTSIRMNAPAFGEHNEYVLREIIGLNDAEVAELYDNHITSDEPNLSAHQ
jgi:crotonobetainyl-CoA:carnitine CoA-transferase CaiB-like acyl-CoA transferase